MASLQAEPSPDDYEKEIVDTTTLSPPPCDDITRASTHLLLNDDDEIESEAAVEVPSNNIESHSPVPTTKEESYEETQDEPESTPNAEHANGSIKNARNGHVLALSKENGTSSLATPSDESAATAISFSQYSTLKRHKRNSDGCKPPNVLVYSESNATRSNVISTIKKLLHPDRYTIYDLNTEQLKTSFWIDNTTLLIVCGSTSQVIGSILMEYYLCGGKMLCLCSDVLNMLLPIYRTAEVRENELVQFSYADWHKVQLMHHIFCYHPSPIKKHFSVDNDDQQDNNHAKP